jgi:phosphoglycolate phosphatase-like HAD superfamily hydrolase
MRRLILFDIDGTILATNGAGRAAMEDALRSEFGTSGDPAYRYDGKTDMQIVRDLMRGAGFDDAEIDQRMAGAMRRYVDGLREHLNGAERTVELYPGVAALIDAVEQRDDAVLGLLTGNVEPGARLKLASVGIDIDRFRVNAFGSDHEVRRELPAIAHQRMCDAFGVTLAGRDVVVIGDTPADIDCGRALGARAIAVATGRYSVEQLLEHDPFAVFQDLTDTEAVMAAVEA